MLTKYNKIINITKVKVKDCHEDILIIIQHNSLFCPQFVDEIKLLENY